MRISDWSSDMCSSDLQTAIDGKAGGKQRAPKAAAGVECCRKTAKVEARMLRAEAAHHPAVAAVGAVEGGKAAAAPPETVFLGPQRPLGLEAGVYDQQSPALVPGCIACAELGRATCGERGCQYGWLSWSGVQLKTKKNQNIIR